MLRKSFMELHEIIKQHRIDSGLTQEELAKKLYITRQSISRWETGKRNPPLNALYDLAKIYDLTLEELLGGKIVKKFKFNFLSLLGSLFFNFFLLSTFGLVLVSTWLSLLLLLITFVFSPIILFTVNITGQQAFAWDQTFYVFIFFILGLIFTKPMIWLSKFLYRCILRYFRYNISSIYYEVK